jgi:hypothetical protein
LHACRSTLEDPHKVIKKSEEYLKFRYHQVTDEMEDDWDMSGAIQLIRWAREIASLLGRQDKPLQFKPDSYFQRPTFTP